MRAQYDEDLELNPFFVSFKLQQPLLFENSIKKNWIILIPYYGSFSKEKYDDFDFLNHVLVPVFDDNLCNNQFIYKNLGNQKVRIHDSTILIYSKEPSMSKKIQILFDETYYTDNDRTYRVLCISEPLTSEISKLDKPFENGKVFSLNSVEDSKIFLWKIMAKQVAKSKVEDLISQSKSNLQKLNSPTIQDCHELVKDLYVSSLQIITSRKTYVNLVSKNENLKNSTKLALEMFLHNCLSSVLFPVLTDATAERDEEINRATRIFQNMRASISGIRFDMCENIPKAKKELYLIRRTTTPLEICECIRKVIAELSSFHKPKFSLISVSKETSDFSINKMNTNSTSSHSLSSSASMVNSDDLLSALVFLVIKAEIPNWNTYLEYASNFRFANCSRDDEYQYYLTTLEATLEHIRNMGSNIIKEDFVMDVSATLSSSLESSLSNGNTELSTSQNKVSSGRIGAIAYEINQVRQLFRLIESGQTSAIKELIQRSYRFDYLSMVNRRTVGPSNFNNNHYSNDHYCHPLCDCKIALVDRKSCHSLVERSKNIQDIQTLPGSKTFDTAESAQKKYSFHFSQSPAFSLASADEKGWNAIHKAAYCGQLEIISILMDFQYLINSTNLEGETPLHLAARRGHQDIIFKLLDAGAEIDVRNYTGQTALHIAVEYGFSTCVSTLIYYGSLQSNMIVNCVNNSGNTPLHIAAMWGYESIVKCLLDNSASAIVKNNRGHRPAEVASTRKLAVLLNVKAHQQELESISTETTTFITNILQHNSTQTKYSINLPMLKPKILDISKIQKSDKYTPKDLLLNCNSSFANSVTLSKKIEKLLKVVADGDLQMLKFLLEIPEETEITDPIDIHQKLCHPLCQCSKCHPIQDLIIKSTKNQLNINSTNKEGFSCLHIAAIHDRSTIAKFLLHYGADSNGKTNKLGLTPLHLAAIYGGVKVLNILLLQKNVCPNVVDKKLNTPLLYSCTKSKVDIVDSLLQKGVLINTSNHRGNSPLHEAVRHNQKDIVKLLLKYGAKVNQINNKGFSPFDLAKDLNIYFILKNSLSIEIKRTTGLKIERTESGTSLNSSLHVEHCMLNVETDDLSSCSDLSLRCSEEDYKNTSVDPLFPEDSKIDINSHFELDKCYSPNNDFDASLLERVDQNSKYNYRLTFKDPNSSSISSTNSSK